MSANIINDITTRYVIPANVRQTFKTACNDCHSNKSEYPWYSNFQPVAWFMNGHIIEGKRHLNFSVFTSYKISKQYKLLDEINHEVKSGGMPISSYTLIHRNANLSLQQKLEVENWTISTMKQIEKLYPPDSLKKK